MRFALITGLNDKKHSVLVEPCDPRDAMKQFKGLKSKPGDLSDIYLWDSLSGICARHKFKVVPQATPPEKNPETEQEKEPESEPVKEVEAEPEPQREPEPAKAANGKKK